MDEVKVLKRGKNYVTPFSEAHIEELCVSLAPESKYELRCLGYHSTKEALMEMLSNAECYVAKSDGGPILAVGGVFFDHTAETPQFFTMFTVEVKENFTALARTSKMFVNFFDQTQPSMSLSILSEFELMLDWAAWLNFEAVGISEHNGHSYVEFVRCNPKQKNVSDNPSRPVMH